MLAFSLLLEASVEVTAHLVKLGAAFAAVIAVFAAAWGIGKIGKSAIEAMARQPENANDFRASMVVASALIEGATFFAIVVCLLVLFI